MAVREAGSIVDVGRSVPVGVQGMGWKGVGVGEAFGATVTRENGTDCGVGAAVPHPASRTATRMIQRVSFIAVDWSGMLSAMALRWMSVL